MDISHKWKYLASEFLSWMTEDQIIQNFKMNNVEENPVLDLNFVYMAAREQKKCRVLDYLVQECDLKRHFLNLPKLLEDKRYDLLPIPKSIAFQDGIDSILDESPSSGKFERYKQFMDCSLKHGTVFINNFTIMSFLFEKLDQAGAYDSFFKLDHRLEIDPFYEFNNECYQKLLDYYSLNRVFKLMVASGNGADYIEQDIISLLNTLEALPLEIRSRVIPKKPNNLKKLHDDLSKALIPHTKKGISLNQDLIFLDGIELEGFKIEVPKLSDDLIETSEELDHCVHTYINIITSGICNVINLKQNEKRQYTLELAKEDDGNFNIIQFKGFRNEDSMEGHSGEIIRTRILELIQKNINNLMSIQC
jgi:hypothetical protein